MVMVALLPKLRRAISPPLRIGDRIRLSGGYDNKPTWLGARTSIEGVVLTFVESSGAASRSAIIKLGSALSAEGLSSDLIALDLRYKSARWGQHELVHVRLLNEMPGGEDQSRALLNGKWIGSHASYTVVR